MWIRDPCAMSQGYTRTTRHYMTLIYLMIRLMPFLKSMISCLFLCSQATCRALISTSHWINDWCDRLVTCCITHFSHNHFIFHNFHHMFLTVMHSPSMSSRLKTHPRSHVHWAASCANCRIDGEWETVKKVVWNQSVTTIVRLHHWIQMSMFQPSTLQQNQSEFQTKMGQQCFQNSIFFFQSYVNTKSKNTTKEKLNVNVASHLDIVDGWHNIH